MLQLDIYIYIYISQSVFLSLLQKMMLCPKLLTIPYCMELFYLCDFDKVSHNLCHTKFVILRFNMGTALHTSLISENVLYLKYYHFAKCD